MPDTIFKYVKSVTNEGRERESNETGQIVEASMHSNPSGSFFLFGTASSKSSVFDRGRIPRLDSAKIRTKIGGNKST